MGGKRMGGRARSAAGVRSTIGVERAVKERYVHDVADAALAAVTGLLRRSNSAWLLFLLANTRYVLSIVLVVLEKVVGPTVASVRLVLMLRLHGDAPSSRRGRVCGRHAVVRDH